jgi:hypothetical protein
LLPECVDCLRRLIDRGDTDHSGVMACPIEQITAQKYDLQFGTNVIGKVSIFFGLFVVH